MGRRSAAGAGAAAAQVEASSAAAGPKDHPAKGHHRRKRSMIFVKKTLVKPQSPKKDSDNPQAKKLPPSPPPMPARAQRQGKRKSSPRGVAPSPPRIRDGKVVSPSPMSRPRVNGHYTPPKYTSPPPGYGPGGRHPSPPPPVGIRGRPARCLSPSPSPSPPPEPRGRKTQRTSYSPSPDRNRGPRSPPSRMSPTRGPRYGRGRSPSSRSPSPSAQSTVICGMQPPFPTRPPPQSPPMGDGRYGSRGGIYGSPPSRVPHSPPMADRALEEIYASSSRIPSSPTMRGGGRPGGRGGVYASPPRLPPSPPMRGRMQSRGGIYGSDTRVPSTPQVRGRAAGSRGGVYASPPRLPQFPSDRSRSRAGHRSPPPPSSRMPPASVPRSRRASPSPPPRMMPPSPDFTMRASRSQQRRPQATTSFPHIPPISLSQQTGRSRADQQISLSRHDSAIRGLSPVRIDPIPSPIYERLSPVPQSGKRGRSPSPPTPVPIPGYLASKPPLPPQALSSRRPLSPSHRRTLGGPSSSSSKRSPSPDLKRRYSCVTVIPRDVNFSPHLPRPPPTAPSNFKRIAPNFAARRSRKASFVILNEKTVKRKSDSRRGSVDEGELGHHEGEGEDGEGGKEGEDGETAEGRKKSGKGKSGKTKAVSIVLVEDEEEPDSARSKGSKLSARKTKESGGLSPRPPSGGRSSPAALSAAGTPRGEKVPSPRPSATPRDPGQEPLQGATLGAPVSETHEAATASGSESHRDSSRAPSASLVPPPGSAASRAGTPTPGGDPAAVSRAATPVPGSAGGDPSRAPSAAGIRDQKQILEAGSLGATSPSPVPTEVSGGKPAATPTDKPVSIQGVTGGEGEGYTPRSGGGSILEGSVATQGGKDAMQAEDGSGDGEQPASGGQEKRGSIGMERIEEEHDRVERMEIGETAGDESKATGGKSKQKLERQKTVDLAAKKESTKAEKGPVGAKGKGRPGNMKGTRNAGRSQDDPAQARNVGGMRSSGSVKSLGKDDDQISQKSLRSSKSTSSVRSLGKAEDRRSLGSTGSVKRTESVSSLGKTEQKTGLKASDSVRSLGRMDDQQSARSSRSGSIRSLGKTDDPMPGRSRGSSGSVKSLGQLEDQMKGNSVGSLRSVSSSRGMGSMDDQLSVKSSGSTRSTGARQRSASLRTSVKPPIQASMKSSESIGSLVKAEDNKASKGRVLSKSSSTAGSKQAPKPEGSVRRTQSIQSINKEGDEKSRARVLGKQKSTEKGKKMERPEDESHVKNKEVIQSTAGAKNLEIVGNQESEARTQDDDKVGSRPGSAKDLKVPEDDSRLKKTTSLDKSDGEKTPSRPSSGSGLGKPIDRSRKESIKSSMLKFMINMDNEDEVPSVEKKDSLEKPDVLKRRESTQGSDSEGSKKDASDKSDGEKTPSRPSSGRGLGKPIDRSRKESIKSSMLKFMINMDNEDEVPSVEKKDSLEKPDAQERRASTQGSDSEGSKKDASDKSDGEKTPSRPSSGRGLGKPIDRSRKESIKSSMLKFMINMDNEVEIPPVEKKDSLEKPDVLKRRESTQGSDSEGSKKDASDKSDGEKTPSRPSSGRGLGKTIDRSRKESIKSSMLKFMINMDNEDEVPSLEKKDSLEKPDAQERRANTQRSDSESSKKDVSRPGSSLGTGKAEEKGKDKDARASRPGSAKSIGKSDGDDTLKKTEGDNSAGELEGEKKQTSRPSSGRGLGKPIDGARKESIKSSMLKFMINMDNEEGLLTPEKSGSLEKPDEKERRESIQSSDSGDGKRVTSRPGSGRSDGKHEKEDSEQRESPSGKSYAKDKTGSRPGSSSSIGKPDVNEKLTKTGSNKSLDKLEPQKSLSRPGSGGSQGKPLDKSRKQSIKSSMLKFMINMDNEDDIPNPEKSASLEKPDEEERRGSIKSSGSSDGNDRSSRPGSSGKTEVPGKEGRRESLIPKSNDKEISPSRPGSAKSLGKPEEDGIIKKYESNKSLDKTDDDQKSQSRLTSGRALGKPIDRGRKESIKNSMLKFMINMDNEDEIPSLDKGDSLEKPEGSERRQSIQSTGSTGSKQNESRPGSARSTAKAENENGEARRDSVQSTREIEYHQSATRPASAKSSDGSKDQPRRESGQSSDGAEGTPSASRPSSGRRIGKSSDQARKESIKNSMLKYMLTMDNEDDVPTPGTSGSSKMPEVGGSEEMRSSIDKITEGEGGKDTEATGGDIPASGDQENLSAEKNEENTGHASDGVSKLLEETVGLKETGNLATAGEPEDVPEGGGSEVGSSGKVTLGKENNLDGEHGDNGVVATAGQGAGDAEARESGSGLAEPGDGQTSHDDFPVQPKNPIIEIQSSTPMESSAENSVAGDPPSTPTTPRVE